MADGSKIEWTDATWNPITGCSIVSPGCTNCYAMKLAGTRLKHHESRAGLTKESKSGPVWTGEVRFNEQWLTQPLKWSKPRMIFVCAHGDLFAEGVPDEWIDQVFAVMALAPQHTFQVLTKRPERMREYFTDVQTRSEAIDRQMNAIAPEHWCKRELEDYAPDGLPLPNVWLGTSVEDQKRADELIPILLDTPAAIRWISAEPLLGPINLYGWCTAAWDGDIRRAKPAARIQWVVAGGESGPNARPMHPDWARSLRDQCAAAGVPFLFKQWGEWAEACPDLRDADGRHLEVDPDSEEGAALYDAAKNRLIAIDGRQFTPETLPPDTPARLIERVGKRAAGRLLDGVEHNAFPQVKS